MLDQENSMVIFLYASCITLFRSLTIVCGTDNVSRNIPHIHSEYEEYMRIFHEMLSVPLLWIWIVLCEAFPRKNDKFCWRICYRILQFAKRLSLSTIRSLVFQFQETSQESRSRSTCMNAEHCQEVSFF